MISCLNVHRGIYWVNSRFGTPITQILGLVFFVMKGIMHRPYKKNNHNILKKERQGHLIFNLKRSMEAQVHGQDSSRI